MKISEFGPPIVLHSKVKQQFVMLEDRIFEQKLKRTAYLVLELCNLAETESAYC